MKLNGKQRRALRQLQRQCSDLTSVSRNSDNQHAFAIKNYGMNVDNFNFDAELRANAGALKPNGKHRRVYDHDPAVQNPTTSTIEYRYKRDKDNGNALIVENGRFVLDDKRGRVVTTSYTGDCQSPSQILAKDVIATSSMTDIHNCDYQDDATANAVKNKRKLQAAKADAMALIKARDKKAAGAKVDKPTGFDVQARSAVTGKKRGMNVSTNDLVYTGRTTGKQKVYSGSQAPKGY